LHRAGEGLALIRIGDVCGKSDGFSARLPPAFVISLATSLRKSILRAPKPTFAPSAAAIFAMAWPIPGPTPLIMIVLSFKSMRNL